MSFSKAKYVTVCQQFLVTAAVLAVGLSAAGVVTLQIVSPQDVQTPNDAQSAVKIEKRPVAPTPVEDTAPGTAPVMPKVREVAVTGVDPAAKTLPETGEEPAARQPAAQDRAQAPQQADEKPQDPKNATKLAAVSAPTKVTGYATVGVTWTGAESVSEEDIAIQVRTKKDGTWSRWSSAEYHDDHGPDIGSGEGRQVRPGTDAVVIGDVDEVQMRAETATGAVPAGMELAVIDPGAGKLRKEAPAIDTAKLPSAQSGVQKDAQQDAQGAPYSSPPGATRSPSAR